MELKDINSPHDLIRWMDQIEYGWLDKDYNKQTEFGDFWWENYRFSTPEDVEKHLVGTCYEQTYLAKKVFKEQAEVSVKTYFIQGKGGNTHTMLVFQQNGKWWYFEHSYARVKGIYGPYDKPQEGAEQAGKFMMEDPDEPITEYRIVDISDVEITTRVTAPEIYKLFQYDWEYSRGELEPPSTIENISINNKTISGIDHLVKFKEHILRRDFIIDMLTECERVILNETLTIKNLYVGQIVELNNKLVTITNIDGSSVACQPITNLPVHIHDIFKLKHGDIENFNDDKPTATTVGRFILNYAFLAQPFGNTIPYINTSIKIGKIENMIVEKALAGEIEPNQIADKYYQNVPFIGHFTEIWAPSSDADGIVPPEHILKRKDELIEQHKDELEKENPLIMAKIEDELIAMLREHLKNNDSYGFYGSSPKYINKCLKRMFLMSGIMSYQENGKTRFKFVTKSLDDEWDIDAFPESVNEVRAGIHGRSKDTAKAGELVEFIRRIFQECRIVEEDCHTNHLYSIKLYPQYREKMLYANIVDGNELITLTPDNIDKYIGKTLNFRRPQGCKTKNGYCYKCMGFINEIRQTTHPATDKSRISSAFLSQFMASFHGTKHDVYEISTNLNRYIL